LSSKRKMTRRERKREAAAHRRRSKTAAVWNGREVVEQLSGRAASRTERWERGESEQERRSA
jgi:hypothetical protein